MCVVYNFCKSTFQDEINTPIVGFKNERPKLAVITGFVLLMLAMGTLCLFYKGPLKPGYSAESLRTYTKVYFGLAITIALVTLGIYAIRAIKHWKPTVSSSSRQQ